MRMAGKEMRDTAERHWWCFDMTFVEETLTVDGGKSGSAQTSVSGDKDGVTANENAAGHGNGGNADGMVLLRAGARLGSRSTDMQSAVEAVALSPVCMSSQLRSRALDKFQSSLQDHKIQVDWREDSMELHTKERECIGSLMSTVIGVRRRSSTD